MIRDGGDSEANRRKQPKWWPLWAILVIVSLSILVFTLSSCSEGSSSSPEPPEPEDGPPVIVLPVSPPEALVKKLILNWLEQFGAVENEEVGAWTVESPLPLYCFPRD